MDVAFVCVSDSLETGQGKTKDKWLDRQTDGVEGGAGWVGLESLMMDGYPANSFTGVTIDPNNQLAGNGGWVR